MESGKTEGKSSLEHQSDHCDGLLRLDGKETFIDGIEALRVWPSGTDGVSLAGDTCSLCHRSYDHSKSTVLGFLFLCPVDPVGLINN